MKKRYSLIMKLKKIKLFSLSNFYQKKLLQMKIYLVIKNTRGRLMNSSVNCCARNILLTSDPNCRHKVDFKEEPLQAKTGEGPVP